MRFREVVFKKWVEREAVEIKDDSGKVTGHTTKPGTSCYDAEFIHKGLFHQWASACVEGENFGNYTVAIVELPNGEVVEVLPSNIKFTEK